MLIGCNISDNEQVEATLSRISCFNDKIQGLIFDLNQLAPTCPDSMITRSFPFSTYYGEDEVRQVNEQAWRLEVTGLISDRRQWSLANLRVMQQYDQVTRHICTEGWGAIGKWGGVRFGDFLRRVGVDLNAKYVGFKCVDNCHTSTDMVTALCPQTLMAITYNDAPLPSKYGFPMKLRMPTKLGYKNPRRIQAIFVTNTYPGGCWEDQGYNWLGRN